MVIYTESDGVAVISTPRSRTKDARSDFTRVPRAELVEGWTSVAVIARTLFLAVTGNPSNRMVTTKVCSCKFRQLLST